MPRKIIDPHTRAITFVPTEDERDRSIITKRVRELESKVSELEDIIISIKSRLDTLEKGDKSDV